MKPTHNPDSHAEYRRQVWERLSEQKLLSNLPSTHLELARQFCDLDLSDMDRIMMGRYSSCGPRPRQPSDMLRSMLLSAAWGVSSYTEWARLLKTVPFLAIVSGFAPDDVPGIGTFYDFIDRLWMSDEDNFSPSVQPRRLKPPKPARKGEKAPSIEKKPVEDLIEAFQKTPPDALSPCRLLFELFESVFLQRSAKEGLIDLKALNLAGDGTPLYAAARERSKRTCSCTENGVHDCSCDRRYSQPDCNWGYDSHRRCYYYGYDLYLFTDPASGHDLPIIPYLGPASRHDSHGFVHAWFAAKSLLPEFHADRVFLDSAHDALAIYDLMAFEDVQAFIDLNKGHSTTLEQKGYTIGPDGIPVCRDGHPMKAAGFDKAQHRLKYRCPKISKKNGCVTCDCENPCSTAKYGRQVHVYPASNPRLFCVPPRGSKQWKTAYNLRTGSERANKRIKMDYKLEDGRYRSSKNWYCRLFVIMMQIHHDAWLVSEAETSQVQELRAAA